MLNHLAPTLSLSELFIFATGLVTVFNPPAAVAFYAPVTGHFSEPVRRRIAIQMFRKIALVLLVTLWVGQSLLQFLGVTVSSLTVTGGVVLLLGSMPMILSQTSPRARAPSAPPPDGSDPHIEWVELDWSTLVIIPLIFPLSIGAGSVSLIIATSGRYSGPVDLLALSAVCVAYAALIGFTQYCAGPISQRLGAEGMRALKPLSGIILCAIAFQMLARGLVELLPGLGPR